MAGLGDLNERASANVVIKPETISEVVASPIGADGLNDHIMAVRGNLNRTDFDGVEELV
jgi:hypothetical protein